MLAHHRPNILAPTLARTRNALRRVAPDWIGVDFFCGLGGSTTGGFRAGVEMRAGANHWPAAIASYRANHLALGVQSFLEDMSIMDPHKLLPLVGAPRKRRRRLLAMGSPSCTGHSDARGRERPEHDKARMTATGLQHCWELLLPDMTFTENTVEFLDWSSLLVMQEEGWRQRLKDRITVYRGSNTPEERRAGKLFMAWKSFMEGLGYKLTINIVNAMYFGVAQERERVIIIGSLHEQPKPVLHPPRARIITAAEVLDFEDDSVRWTPFSKIRSEGVKASILRGIEDGCGERFLKLYYGSGSGLTGRTLDRPLPTIPGADVIGLVDCTRGPEPHVRIATLRELRKGMSFDEDYIVMGTTKKGEGPIIPYEEGGARADATAQVGNAVPPLMAQEIILQMAA